MCLYLCCLVFKQADDYNNDDDNDDDDGNDDRDGSGLRRSSCLSQGLREAQTIGLFTQERYSLDVQRDGC